MCQLELSGVDYTLELDVEVVTPELKKAAAKKNENRDEDSDDSEDEEPAKKAACACVPVRWAGGDGGDEGSPGY